MCMYDVCAMCMYDVSVCVSEFWGKSTHFDGKTTRFGLQIQIPTRFQTISLWALCVCTWGVLTLAWVCA